MDKVFCENCGSRLDMSTGLCPNCQPSAINRAFTAQNDVKNKKAKTGGIIAIAVLVVLIIAVSGTAVYFLTKGRSPVPKQDAKTVRTTYASYLRDTIITEYGVVDTNNLRKSAEGVYSAEIHDLDGDKNDEFVVAYAKKNGKNIEYNISCYKSTGKSAKKKNSKNQTAEGLRDDVELLGTVTPVTERDYTAFTSSSDEMRFPCENILYRLTYEGKTYIVFEHLSYYEGYEYSCHIYSLEAGKFVEAGNIIYEALGSDGTEVIYSTTLPKDVTIENSTEDFANRENAEYIKDAFDKGYVWFYKDGADLDYTYTKYYQSHEDALTAFYKLYGIEKTSDVKDGDDSGRYVMLVRPENVEYIYSYVFYIKYDYENNTETEEYEFNDFTDLKSLINEKQEETTQQTEKETLPDLSDSDLKLFEDLLETSFMWTSRSERGEEYTVDFSKMTQAEVAAKFFVPPDVYKLYDKNYSYENCGDPQHKFDWEVPKLNAKTADWVFNNIFNVNTTHEDGYAVDEYSGNKYLVYYYDGDYMYAQSFEGGFVGSMDYVIGNYEKLDSGEYDITVTYDYYGDDVKEVFDEPETKFDEEKYTFHFYVKLKEDETFGKYWSISKYTYTRDGGEDRALCAFDHYMSTFYDEQDDEMYTDLSVGPQFSMYDIDGDGLSEFILLTGDCEANYSYEVYTYTDKLVHLGSIGGTHAGLYYPDDGVGIYRYATYAGDHIYGDLSRYTIENGKLKEEVIYEDKIIDDEEDEYEWIKLYEIGDLHEKLVEYLS